MAHFKKEKKMNHQKLECYKRTIQVAKALQAVMPTWPPGTSALQDQARRAVDSSVLNLVEGNGRRTTKDRRCFFTRANAVVLPGDHKNWI